MAEELATPPAPAETHAAPAPHVTDTASLSEHESVFGPADPTLEGDAKVKNDEQRAKVRHRAKSQQAGPEDAPRIQELTKKLRAAEAERDAIKARSQPANSQPAAREPAAALSSERETPARSAPATSAQPYFKTDPATGLPEGWVPTRPEPTEDDIGTKYQTYAAMTRDQAFWVQEQVHGVRQAEEAHRQQQRQQAEGQQSWQQAHTTFSDRVAAFAKTHTDYQSLLDQHKAVTIPPAAYQAILRDENGPSFVYHLTQHPDQLSELVLLFDGKPPSDEYVAHATRWLSSRTQAAATGSAAPTPPLTLAARPPNPVRTGPSKSDGEPPGDESMSLSEHERAYGQRRRR